MSRVVRVIPYLLIGTCFWLLLFPPTMSVAVPSVAVLVDSTEQGREGEVVTRSPAALATAPDSLILATGIGYQDWRYLRSSVNVDGLGSASSSVRIPDRVTLGDSLRVVFRDGNMSHTVLRVDGLPVSIDSAGTGTSVLSYVPPDTGTYAVEVLHGDSVIGKTGVQVDGPRPLRVLIVESSPSFETTRLRSWLTRRGNPVMRRTRISRDRYRTEFFGTDSVDFDRIRSELLDQHDLLVIDDVEYAQLSATQRNDIQESVRDGLGVVFMLTGTRDPADASFGRWRLEDGTGATEQVWVSGSRVGVSPVEIDLADSWAPVLTDDVNRVLAATRTAGLGKKLVTRISGSYRLLLAGDSAAYAGLWSAAVNRVARPDSAERWGVAPQPNVVGEAVVLFLRSQAIEPLATVRSPGGLEERLPLRQEHYDPRVWSGLFWPTADGWYTVRSDSDALSFYVSREGDWRQIEVDRRIRLARIASLFGVPTTPRQPVSERPLHPGYVLIILSLCMGWLWYRERRAS